MQTSKNPSIGAIIVKMEEAGTFSESELLFVAKALLQKPTVSALVQMRQDSPRNTTPRAATPTTRRKVAPRKKSTRNNRTKSLRPNTGLYSYISAHLEEILPPTFGTRELMQAVNSNSKYRITSRTAYNAAYQLSIVGKLQKNVIQKGKKSFVTFSLPATN